jgi:hypothetical protein
MRLRRFAFVLLPACLSPALASADIYRCQSPSGTAYQQVPCGDEASGGLAGIASEYPPANLAERERLFQREEAMYKRLEAQRERLAQEAIARQVSAKASPQPADEAASAPVFIVGQPIRRWHRPHPYRGTLQR